jgi:hypothetical protein
MKRGEVGEVRVFGIRHHGAGSARSLRAALEDYQPDAVLIEGPPEADKIIPLAAHPDMQPPVALLIYNSDKPKMAAWYPFAVFSPEWQAIQYTLQHGVPAQFMDLPQKHALALHPFPSQDLIDPETSEESSEPVGVPKTSEESPESVGVGEMSEESSQLVAEPTITSPLDLMLRFDPLRALAEAAGYDDSERWWEQMVEERHDSRDLFAAILEAMRALRSEAEALPLQQAGQPARSEATPYEPQREAWMRRTIAGAQKRHDRVAVVCGAWHAPALADRAFTPEDEALLDDLPSVPTKATWAPWTYSRISRDAGYGAGITSPGWYHHLWETAPADISPRWLAKVAVLLRSEDLNASTAQVIDAVRLAQTLAALRGRPLPGLSEMNEAALSVFCQGSSEPLALIRQKLIVGERMGAVPEGTPTVPLQRDLETQQKALRLKPELEMKQYDLDLRKPNDLARSHLLHRLALLGVRWGIPEQSRVRAAGTFHEYWRVQWQPEFTVGVIEASVWGNTVLDAAAEYVRDKADHAPDLPALTQLLDGVLLADLPDAARHVMTCVQNAAALTSDTGLLMDALPSLVNVLRYGSVRQTDTEMVAHVVDGLVARICIGVVPACASLDDDAAEQMFTRITNTNSAVGLLQNAAYTDQWHDALHMLADRPVARTSSSPGLHGLVAGRAVRILRDVGALDSQAAGTRMKLALSLAIEPPQAAAWVEGFLRGSGAVLLHDEALWQLLDEWVVTLPENTFTMLLPLLRRTFSTFQPPDRREMLERARYGVRRAQEDEAPLNVARAERVLPLLSRLLGLQAPSGVEGETL